MKKRAETLLHQLVSDLLALDDPELRKEYDEYLDGQYRIPMNDVLAALRKVGPPYYSEDEVTDP